MSTPIEQLCFNPSLPDFNPGIAYRTCKRGFQGCPTLLRTPKGTLYAGWTAGGPGEGLLNYNLLVKSVNDGISWSPEPLMVIPSQTEKRIQALDPEFWLDPLGRFWFFWTQRDHNIPWEDDRHFSVWAIVCDDPDAETLQWSEPRYISPGFLRCQPTVLRDGRWLLCAYQSLRDRYYYTETADQGKTFFRRIGGKKCKTWFDETQILERQDGSLWMLARTLGLGYVAESVSTDGGGSWSDGRLTDIPNPGSRFYVGRLQSGRVLYVSNLDQKTRIGMTAMLSEDDGKTWPYKLALDPRLCTYPDAIQSPTGEIYIVHDNSRVDTKEILFYKLTEEDIMQGRDESGNWRSKDSYFRQIVNKAPAQPDLTEAEKALFAKYPKFPDHPTKTIAELEALYLQ